MRVVYHLGYGRTASTLLQKYIFPIHKDLNYLGSKDYRSDMGVKITQAELNHLSDKYLDTDIEDNNIYPLEKNYHELFSKDKVNIISGERYTSYKVISNNFREFKYLNKILRNQNIDFSIEFLIVLRSQYEIIRSIYHNAYQSFSRFLNINNFNTLMQYFKNCDHYINFNEDVKNGFENIYNFKLFADQYDFYKLLNNLIINFKDCKFKFLFYEDLKNNPKVFVNDFSNFFNVDSDYTYSLFDFKKKVNPVPTSNGKIIYDSNISFFIGQNDFYKKVKKFIPS